MPSEHACYSIRHPDAGEVYEFTGARSNFSEFADVFSQVLGRKITYVPITFEQAEPVMKSRGLPDWLISHQRTAGQIAANGRASPARSRSLFSISPAGRR